MVCDIHGWIEAAFFAEQDVNHENKEYNWYSVANLKLVLDRTYIVFGRLSHDGSRQYEGDRALFKDRGLPDNIDEETRENYEKWGEGTHHETHFTHHELVSNKIQIEVPSGETVDRKPIDYLREGIENYNPKNPNADFVRPEVNNSMRYGRHKRSWESAFKISEGLAHQCGEKQVRWVIWFDN